MPHTMVNARMSGYNIIQRHIIQNGKLRKINDGINELNTDGDAFAQNERVRIPVVDGQTYYLRVFGRSVDVINNYSITAINEAPPTPFDLELQDTPVGAGSNSDTGQSQTDNVTHDDTPTIFLRLDDGLFRFDVPGNAAATTPVDQVIRIPFQTAAQAGFRMATFDEGPTPSQSATPPQSPVGFATTLGSESRLVVFLRNGHRPVAVDTLAQMGLEAGGDGQVITVALRHDQKAEVLTKLSRNGVDIEDFEWERYAWTDMS